MATRDEHARLRIIPKPAAERPCGDGRPERTLARSACPGMRRKEDLTREIDSLKEHLPDWAARLLDMVRAPHAVWVRVPLAIVLMAGGFVGFLPILGFWMLPLGLALLAVDLPFMRPPMARLLAFINGKLDKA